MLLHAVMQGMAGAVMRHRSGVMREALTRRDLVDALFDGSRRVMHRCETGSRTGTCWRVYRITLVWTSEIRSGQVAAMGSSQSGHELSAGGVVSLVLPRPPRRHTLGKSGRPNLSTDCQSLEHAWVSNRSVTRSQDPSPLSIASKPHLKHLRALKPV